ncbi:Tetratricopeptide repeat-containing protein [Pedobacter insulae]|uniref:Tetratricopeptide repeat-containing protein n=2 Tax=Pedobacter insulae TaxID=414048 RepID=A0A1I2YF14_9SPHI|nr:Tetratricopeptide repeat-containing protein [Pedobacter insulae]
MGFKTAIQTSKAMRKLVMIGCNIISVFTLMNSVNGQGNPVADSYFIKAADFRKNMKTDSALIYYEKAAVQFQNLGNIEKFVDSYNQIGVILTRGDAYEKAKVYLDKALGEGLKSLDSNNLAIATTYISLGVIYNALAKYDQSLVYHYKALSIRRLKLGDYHTDVATSYGNIGNVHRNNKEIDKSIAAHLEALKIREKILGETSAEIIGSYEGLGNAYREKKEYGTSLGYFERALKNKLIQRGEGHKDLIKYYKYISEVYYLMGNKFKGDQYKQKSENQI